jgi:hypothetical protein
MGIIESPLTNASTDLWDLIGSSLFYAPYLSSTNVIFEIKQFSRPFCLIRSSKFSFPRKKKTQIFVSSRYCIKI